MPTSFKQLTPRPYRLNNPAGSYFVRLLDTFWFAASKNSRNTQYQFWQQNNHAEELLTNHFTDQKLEYIHQSSVQEGWVEEANCYLYSSARAYSGLPGLVPITFID
ncbi:hypothetical protein AAE02nite_47210 [Adhaeribacter aerolatus]|uniref:Transposase n=1 Tax=Adhaeribacter aerolatus TaxID=670289 RepID=A0A512B5K3_9BACT|nr:hypothetical protein [Adhaeribacter aerolatus]GEO07057.1 hypothetical protein AAE02nite_47210 [Adhaeribacter aerolatus]